MLLDVYEKLIKNRFLFEELVKRDFKKKYKGTALGMVWSVLAPLLTLLVMAIVFTRFFGRDTPHFVVYMFCGLLNYNFFVDATKGGMGTIRGNAGIFTKVNVPKYLFLLSRNVQGLINYLLIMPVFFLFVLVDRIPFSFRFFMLLYPIGCEILFNIGVGMILSAMYVFFRDIQYLYDVFTRLLLYMSAIFYNINKFDPEQQKLFLLNPVYLFIRYFRMVVIEAAVPPLWYHALMAFNTLLALAVGGFMYKKYNTRFLYYV